MRIRVSIYIHHVLAVSNLRIGKVWEWFQDSTIDPSEGVDAREYLQNLVQRYKSFEQIPVNGEVLSEDDDTYVRRSFHCP